MKTKLCIVANDIFEPELLNGGGHRHFLRCIDYWSANYEVIVQAPKAVHDVLRSEFPNIRIASTIFGSVFLDSRPLGTIARCVGSFSVPEADVYYSSSQYLPNLIGPALRRILRRRRRLVVVVHHLIDRQRRSSAGALAALAIFVENAGVTLMRIAATHVFFISREAQEVLARRGFSEHRLTKSTNSISNLSLVRDRSSSRAMEVVYLGNISIRKGALDLLRAWEIVHESIPTASLVFMGQIDPAFAPVFVKRTTELGASVRVLTKCDDKAVAQHFRRARVFATASYEEGWGIVVAEAMYAGLAVVTYDLPAYRDVFGSSRRVAPVGDVTGLAEQIKVMLTDETARCSLVEQADRLFHVMNWQEIAERERRHFSLTE